MCHQTQAMHVHLPISAPWWISVFTIIAMVMATAVHSVSSIQWYPCNLYTNNRETIIKYTTKGHHHHHHFHYHHGISSSFRLISFFFCNFFSDGTVPPSPPPQAECATMPTPLDHDDPNSAKINLFLKRLRPMTQMKQASKVVYVLGGGSGVSEPMETLMERLFTYFDGGFQVYTLGMCLLYIRIYVCTSMHLKNIYDIRSARIR